MSANSKIEWTDHTFNPWMGCTKVTPACDHCYAERSTPARTLSLAWGAGQPRLRTSAANWALPKRWNAQAEAFHVQHGRRQRVFCASLADVFDNEVDPQWRLDLLDLIRRTPNLDWLLLTKRIGNVRRMLGECLALAQEQMSRMQSENGLASWLVSWVDGEPPANVWMGATITSEPEASRDIWKLLKTPSRVRFLSMEPLLGPVDLRSLPMGEGEADVLKPDLWETEIENWRDTRVDWKEDFEDWYEISVADAVGPMHARIDWVIVGGESGPNARPMHPDWVRGLRDQCQAAGVPFLFKQWGEWSEFEPERSETHRMETREGKRLAAQCDGFISVAGEFVRYMDDASTELPYRGLSRLGKKLAGRQLDGKTWDEVPR